MIHAHGVGRYSRDRIPPVVSPVTPTASVCIRCTQPRDRRGGVRRLWDGHRAHVYCHSFLTSLLILGVCFSNQGRPVVLVRDSLVGLGLL